MENILPQAATHANLSLLGEVYPYEIMRKISNKTLEVRKMNYELISGDWFWQPRMEMLFKWEVSYLTHQIT